ncbi:MAG TPA: hypothetical protein VMR18_04870 [Candidatus Saccharimonadales bacterium]|jgi:cytidine deaminase|nr:hypothetical protein [Candidatus Saccharimonadales bacterium]
MNNEYESLIDAATELSLAKQLTDEATSGYAGAALIADNGKVYTGKSLSGTCGISFCGEVNAVMDMLKEGVTHIKAIVTVSNVKLPFSATPCLNYLLS